MKRARGFTLVEVLIVVVIIAILASLVMPRMLAQTEKSKAAEALQMVGVIKRAVERVRDLTGRFPSGYAYSGFGNSDGDWGLIGLKDFGDAKNWGYDFYSEPYVYMFVDAWSEDGSKFVSYGEIADSPENNGWYCDGVFFKNDNIPTKPCRVA